MNFVEEIAGFILVYNLTGLEIIVHANQVSILTELFFCVSGINHYECFTNAIASILVYFSGKFNLIKS